MGLELARAYISVRADATGLDQNFREIQAKTQSALAGLAAGAAALLVPVTSFAKRILGQGISTAAFFETAQTEFGVLIGDAKETEETIRRLTKFANDTPFEMPELLNVSRGLIAAGERGDQLLKTLQMLGDASLGNRDKFQTLALVFNKVRDRTNLTAEYLTQLSEAGVFSARDLAAYFGIPVEQVFKRIESGAVKFEDFRAALEQLTGPGGRAHDLMALISRTLTGLRSTLSDSVNILKATIVVPLLPYLKGATAAVTALSDRLQALVKSGNETVSFAVVGALAFAELAKYAAVASIALRLLGVTWKGALIGTGVGAVVVALGAALGALAGYFQVPKRIGEAWAWMKRQMSGSSAVVENLRDAFYRVRDAMKLIYDAVSPLIRTISASFAAGFTAVARFVAVGLGAAVLRMSEFVLEIAEWLQAVATHWKRVWENMQQVVIVAFSFMVDVAGNAAENLVAAFRSPLGDLVDLVYKIGTELAVALEEPMRIIRGEQFNQNVINGIRAAGKVAAEAAKAQLGVGKNSKPPELFKESERTKGLIKAFGLEGLFGDIEKTKRDLEKKRRQRKPPDDGSKEGDTPPPRRQPAVLQTPAGVYAIEAFGKKLQEVATKSGEDPAIKTNELLDDGLGIQQKMLQALQNPPKNGGLGGGE